MRVLVTGANGFIGKNLVVCLREKIGFEVLLYTRGQSISELNELLMKADAVVHLAGENRSENVEDFFENNTKLTEHLCQGLSDSGRLIPVLFASSIQAELDNPYGRSKLAAEKVLYKLAHSCGNPVIIFRLPGVFGKWSKPNYNSVVATFCNNKALNLPVKINDPNLKLRLVYIDDLIKIIVKSLITCHSGFRYLAVEPEYSISLGDLSSQIDAFKNCRSSLMLERVGSGLTRALYSTFISYLPVKNFSYKIPAHSDARGLFVEMLKTPDSGQFSFLTVNPGCKRGGHYHHTKSEKFLVIRGCARFAFRHILTDETHCFDVAGGNPVIVDTVPGWTHEITNIGCNELIVMLWANEIFDQAHPDTVAAKV